MSVDASGSDLLYIQEEIVRFQNQESGMSADLS